MRRQLGTTLIAGLVLWCVPSWAEAALDSKGTDFWLCFPQNYDSAGSLNLFIAGDEATTGTVSVPGTAFSEDFTVTPGQVTTVNLSIDLMVTATDGVQDKGIHVTAVNEVAVYGLNRRAATTDAYLGLPTDILGTEYLVMSYRTNPMLAVVGTEDGTTVTITPADTIGSRTADTPYQVTVNQGEVYQLMTSGWGSEDLTGSIVTSDKPVAVFGANVCTNVPPGYGACDHMVEQMPPVDAWGKAFVTMPLKTRLNGDTFRILAAEDNTTVTINGTVAATLNRGQYHEQIIEGGSEITSDKSVLVAQYSNGTSYDSVTSDPFMMLVFPYEQFQTDYTITTPASGFSGNYVNIVISTTGVGSVLMDGTAIDVAEFTAIGTSGYSGAQLTIALGSHTFSSTLPFGLAVYGFDNADSYGYPGGGSLAPVNLVSSLSLTPETGLTVTGDPYTVTATILDNQSNPVEGIRVDFTVSGANTSSGSANTDSNGEATFTYSGSATGTDTITATFSSLTDSVTCEWTDTAPVDTDGDGTPDAQDECPDDPDKTEPGTCGCGTADTDTDSDGTPDCDDQCPDDPDKTAPGTCGCGTADTDTDSDGTPDCDDQCPDDPDKTEPGTCGCGTADTDTDSDGTPDCDDQCPDDPDKTEPGTCGCGTADTDTDSDGTLDCDDQCPSDPDKTEPGTAGCGQPEPSDEGEPDLQITVTSTTNSQTDQTPRVGDEVSFLVNVSNVGTAGANGVIITIPLPPNAELVSARFVDDPAGATLPDNMRVEDGELIVDCGDLSPDADVQVELVLRMIESGTVTLEPAAQSDELVEGIKPDQPAEIDVDDNNTRVVTTTTPVGLCGATGMAPLMLTGACLGVPMLAGRRRRSAA